MQSPALPSTRCTGTPVSSSQPVNFVSLVGSAGDTAEVTSSIDFPCDGDYQTCTGSHAGEVTSTAQFLSAVGPLVCNGPTDSVCDADECASSPCLHGGVCVEDAGGSIASWHCDCANTQVTFDAPTYRGTVCADPPQPCCGSDKNGCSGCHTEDHWTDASGRSQRGCSIDTTFWRSCRGGCACVFDAGCCPDCDTHC
jgi:hypothetical protein